MIARNRNAHQGCQQWNFGAEVHREDGDERERVGAEKNGTWTPERKTEDRGRRKEAAFPAWIRRKKDYVGTFEKTSNIILL